MKAINITKQDLVKSMTDEQKHRLALECQLHNVSVEETLDLMKNILNSTLSIASDLTDIYFESPAGKDYLEKRKEIEEIGMGMR